MTEVAVNLPLNAGDAGTFLLRLFLGETLINTGGDTLVEVVDTFGLFVAEVSESLDAEATYRAVITKDGTVIYDGWLRLGVSNAVDQPDGPIDFAEVLDAIDTRATPDDVTDAKNEVIAAIEGGEGDEVNAV